jgi:membrane protease YdiL (CAAX protease family)
MGPFISTEILQAIVSGLMMAIVAGAVASWVWTSRRLLRGEALLPETPIVERREPPWGVVTILLMLAAYTFVSHDAVERYARATRARPPEERAKPPVPVVAKDSGEHGLAKADSERERGASGDPVRDAPRQPTVEPRERPVHNEEDSLPYGLTPRELMFIQGLVSGAFIVLLPLVAWLTSRARLRDLGLSRCAWRRQVAVGVVAVLFLMPIVYAVQFACLSYYRLPEEERKKYQHPVEKMLRENFSPGVASMAFLTAVVIAPVFEEVLFRGYIQSWLIKAVDRSAAGVRLLQVLVRSALIRARGRSAGLLRRSRSPRPLAPRSPDEFDAADNRELSMYKADLDRFAVDRDSKMGYWEAAGEPPHFTTDDDRRPDASERPDGPYRPRSPARTGTAIVLTSLFFALLHWQQWPAPIPLFLLAVGLGVVYQRTGSLIAPICMHAIFNAFSTLMLFLVALQGPEKEKPAARPVLEHATPVEKSKAGNSDVGPGPQRGKT